MPSQTQIDQFTLAFHRVAVARLRDRADLLERAKGTLRRWRAQRGPQVSDAYLDAWDQLLVAGPDAIERAACADGPGAATLRNASPLGFVLSPAERVALRRAAKG